MNLQEQLLEKFSHLSPHHLRVVLAFVERLEQQACEAPAGEETLLDKAERLGIVGLVTDAPPDLSTNKRHLAGLGRD